ncbi:MAG: hypothetical protein AB7L92_00270 [Alphaproteobacteria bacterium]
MSRDRYTPLLFDASEAQPVAVTAKNEWWQANQYRVAGTIRMLSHGLVIVSGMGVGTKPSPLRAATGGLGVLGAAFLATFGEAESGKAANDAKAGFVDRLRPAYVGRTYYGILAASAACLVASGVMKKRTTETMAGLWTLAWTGYGAVMPERLERAGPLVFDNSPTSHKTEGYATRERGKHADKVKHDYAANPKKLASDMLQLSALLVLFDGLSNKDMARALSGICLGTSNFILREMRDENFKPRAKALRQRPESFGQSK